MREAEADLCMVNLRQYNWQMNSGRRPGGEGACFKKTELDQRPGYLGQTGALRPSPHSGEPPRSGPWSFCVL